MGSKFERRREGRTSRRRILESSQRGSESIGEGKTWWNIRIGAYAHAYIAFVRGTQSEYSASYEGVYELTLRRMRREEKYASAPGPSHAFVFKAWPVRTIYVLKIDPTLAALPSENSALSISVQLAGTSAGAYHKPAVNLPTQRAPQLVSGGLRRAG